MLMELKTSLGSFQPIIINISYNFIFSVLLFALPSKYL